MAVSHRGVFLQPPPGGLAVVVQQVASRVVHRFHDEVETDLARIGKEVGKAQGVYGAHRCHGVALDAGDLHQPRDGVACQPQVVLHGDLRRGFDLVEPHLEELGERARRHRARGTDLRLASALRAADGGVRLDHVPDQSARGERPHDLFVRKSARILHVMQYAREHAAASAGGRRHDHAARRVLLAHGKGIRTYEAVFLRLRRFVDVPLVIQVLRPPLGAEAAGQHARRGQPLMDGALHLLPDILQIEEDPVSFAFPHILPQADIFVFAVCGNVVEGREGVHVFVDARIGVRLALDADRSAAHAVKTRRGERFSSAQGGNIQRVGVYGRGGLAVKAYVALCRRERLFQHHVRVMSLARQRERAVQRNGERVRRGAARLHEFRRALGTYGVRTRGAAPDLIKFFERLHEQAFLFVSHIIAAIRADVNGAAARFLRRAKDGIICGQRPRMASSAGGLRRGALHRVSPLPRAPEGIRDSEQLIFCIKKRRGILPRRFLAPIG